MYPEEFIARYKERKMDGDCCGQEFNVTPTGKATHMKCKMHSGVPKHFSTQLGVSIAASHLPAIRSSPSEFLNLSCQFAFFLRPGLDALARVFGLLLPADDVGATRGVARRRCESSRETSNASRRSVGWHRSMCHRRYRGVQPCG